MPQTAAALTARRSAEGHFLQFANAAARDKRLSWRARGILAGMLSHAPGTRFGRDWIISNGTEGREAVTAALRELKSFGYCADVFTHDERGKITGRLLVFCDQPDDANRETENPSYGTDTVAPENRLTGKPSDGKPVLDRRPSLRTPEREEEQVEVEPPVSPASGGADRPVAAAVEIVHDPHPQQPAPAALTIQPPPDPAPKRKGGTRRPPAFSPTAEDIDVHLLPVQRQLLAFWAGKVEYKRGVPSQAAWDLLQAALLRIQQDPEGGTHVVAEQLDAGIQAGWSSVTYANWQRYGKPARVRYGSQTAAPRGPDAWDAVTAMANWRDGLQEHTPEPMRYAI